METRNHMAAQGNGKRWRATWLVMLVMVALLAGVGVAPRHAQAAA